MGRLLLGLPGLSGSSALVPTVGAAGGTLHLRVWDGSGLHKGAVIANITQQNSQLGQPGQTLGTFGISHSAYQVKIAG